MPKKGRPKESGNRSQLLLAMTLSFSKDGCCFEELVSKTGLHRNTIRPNLKTLIFKKRWVGEKREGHKKVYRILDPDLLMKHFWMLGIQGKAESTHEQRAPFRDFTEIGTRVVHKLSYQPVIDITEIIDSDGHVIRKDAYALDKENGLVTFSEQPTGKFRVSYKAGYKETPENIQTASAKLVAGFLKWLVSIMECDTTGIRSIPIETLSQVLPLLKPFKKPTVDARIESLLISLARKNEKIKLLERSEKNLPNFYATLSDLPKWLETMESLKKEKQRIGSTTEWRRLKLEGSHRRQRNLRIKKR
jgi:hypothetical protein